MTAQVPEKLYYKIGEVCEICRIEPHVLRYWETEFSALTPTKNKAGQRIYRREELELIETIKHLLYEQGYTIAGANRKLLEKRGKPPEAEEVPLGGSQKLALLEIRRGLQDILKILDDK